MTNITFVDPNDEENDFFNWMNNIIEEVEDFDYFPDYEEDFNYNNFFKRIKDFSNDSNWD